MNNQEPSGFRRTTPMKTILLADDEANIRTLVHAIVEDSGFQIVEAADGAEALEVARELKPALAILDWMMPAMTGPEVARALRADPATAGTRIVLLTARRGEQDRTAGRSAGADAYLIKPFSPLELLDIVETLLERN
jgi:two-component system, OmpR family, phosphate regulon response regulator PhoB